MTANARKQGVRIEVEGRAAELVRGVQADERMSVYACDIADKDATGRIYGYAHCCYSAYVLRAPAPIPGGIYLDAKHLTSEQLEAINELGWYTGRHATALCHYPEFVFVDDVLREMLTDEEFDVRYREANQ